MACTRLAWTIFILLFLSSCAPSVVQVHDDRYLSIMNEKERVLQLFFDEHFTYAGSTTSNALGRKIKVYSFMRHKDDYINVMLLDRDIDYKAHGLDEAVIDSGLFKDAEERFDHIYLKRDCHFNKISFIPIPQLNTHLVVAHIFWPETEEAECSSWNPKNIDGWQRLQLETFSRWSRRSYATK